MAYSITGIVNLALRRIGVKRIAAMTEDSEQAIDANACWEYVLNEVLEEKDWRFAKRRFALAQGLIIPEYGWDFAYGLPTGFLRMCKPDADDQPIDPLNYPWKIETLSDGNMYLLSDYDNTTSTDDLYITCIVKVVDVTKYSAHFINALAWRIAAELAIGRTESPTKFKYCMDMYQASLINAEGHNQSLDYLEDESGSDSWETAGRE